MSQQWSCETLETGVKYVDAEFMMNAGPEVLAAYEQRIAQQIADTTLASSYCTPRYMSYVRCVYIYIYMSIVSENIAKDLQAQMQEPEQLAAAWVAR